MQRRGIALFLNSLLGQMHTVLLSAIEFVSGFLN